MRRSSVVLIGKTKVDFLILGCIFTKPGSYDTETQNRMINDNDD